jgi:PTH1 family peptidyl-tRNA hydrolase
MHNFFAKPDPQFLPSDSPGNLYLIAGLGNPGREFKANRHNIGFLALDALAGHFGQKFTRVQFKALVARGEHQDRKLLLAKPQTFMNLSGQAVGALAKYYKIPPEALLIIYDDIDLPFGVIRMRANGSSGGQKGMQSIIEKLGTQEIPRLRVGISRPSGRMDAAAHVLQDFSKSETAGLPQVLDRVVEACLVFMTTGVEAAMNQYNPKPETD